MRVLSRHDFMNLPKGTVYAKGKEWYFEGTFIKGHTILDDKGDNIDWFYYDPNSPPSSKVFDTWEDSLKNGTSFKSGVVMRDGGFDADELFLVWEPEDVNDFALEAGVFP